MPATDAKPQIIHVDDDPNILRLIKHQLGPTYDVCSVEDPARCLDELVHAGSRLVILDIEMGQHDGVELLRKIKRFDGGIHVIMLTGLVSMKTVLTSMREGAEACLFKPLNDPKQLHAVVEDSLRKQARWHDTLKELVDRKRNISPESELVPAN